MGLFVGVDRLLLSPDPLFPSLYNPSQTYTLLAHGVGGRSPEIYKNLDKIAKDIKKSKKSSITLLVCEAGQHDPDLMDKFGEYEGMNIAEILHKKTGLPIIYSSSYVYPSPFGGDPFLVPARITDLLPGGKVGTRILW